MKSFLRPIVVTLFLCVVSTAQDIDKAKIVAGSERAFEKVSRSVTLPAPGCAVGVSLHGESVFEKAFGLAELEHNIPNTPQTIFESGSVAKQFTAAALVLLEQDGKLSIDDPVRKYLPELPDYGSPLTIRHILNHTSGIRDWFAIRSLSGEGAGEHIVTQQQVFDTIVRQKGIDFKPGDEFSYSNSGYQLAAMIVERVSKQKLSEFVTERIFKPLGMTNSSYRDDLRRVVPRRAQAYSRSEDGPWRLNMPMMEAHGGGGMLTTIGDWLKWNAMLEARTWNPRLVDSLETQGVLNGGRKISYALGLMHGTYKGLRQISHTGATAGYRTVLVRFPDKRVSIGVLCNGNVPVMNSVAYAVADEIFGPFPAPPAEPNAETKPIEQPEKYVGLWKNERNRAPMRIVINNGELRFGSTPIRAMPGGSITAGARQLTFKFDAAGKPVSMESDVDGDVTVYTAVADWQPAPADLNAFVGDWYSSEAEVTVKIAVDGPNAVAIFRSGRRAQLRPLYKDTFADGGGSIMWFDRDGSGKVVAMHVGEARMRDMPFVRVEK